MMPWRNKAKDRREKRKRGKRLWAATPEWKRTEGLVAVMLRRKGVKCRRIGKVRSPFDIETANSIAIEVKSASYKLKRKSWVVSISRYGKLNEGPVHYYVIALDLGRVFHRAKHKRIYLIVPSPIRRKQLVITLHRLLTDWKENVGRWDMIIEAERRRDQ
jgi:hypothetical protein